MNRLNSIYQLIKLIILKRKYNGIRKYLCFLLMHQSILLFGGKALLGFHHINARRKFKQRLFISSEYLQVIPCVYYINLAHRTDRREQIEHEIEKLQINATRFDAIKENQGALGCAWSHYKVLESWNPNNDSDCIMIIEDDAVFIQPKDYIQACLNKFIANEALDVLLFGYEADAHYRFDELLSITRDAQTMSCYVVKVRAKNHLLEAFALSIQLLQMGLPYSISSIYNVWKLAQSKLSFVISNELVVKQRAGYSDIEQTYKDYHGV